MTYPDDYWWNQRVVDAKYNDDLLVQAEHEEREETPLDQEWMSERHKYDFKEHGD
jgi:hypothetical protein